MSDNRKKKSLNMKDEIIKILSKNPKQAKDLREKLKQKGIDYSRVGLNDLLNLMIDSGDIERIILDNNPYPVYSVTKKSQIRAEIQGRLFQAYFKTHMLKNEELLLKEFESAKHKRNVIDSLIQFFGFYVMGSLIASKSVNKDQRSQWLRTVLDLENGVPMSEYFERLIGHDEEVLKITALFLKQTYKLNMMVLGRCVKNGIENNEKINGYDFSKDMFDFVNERKKK